MSRTHERALQYLLVLDFEATCNNQGRFYPQEIIEFPVVVMKLLDGQSQKKKRADGLSGETWEVVGQFHHYVQPVKHPRLTPFCTELTGITQAMVTGKPSFREVLTLFEEWMQKNFNTWPSLSSSSSLPPPNYTFVTCGDWDLKTMFPNQLRNMGVSSESFKYPCYFQSWINLKKVFGPFLGLGTKQRGMAGMLDYLKIPLVGRHHSGIDDSRNIARIMGNLLDRGYHPSPTTVKRKEEVKQDGPFCEFWGGVKDWGKGEVPMLNDNSSSSLSSSQLSSSASALSPSSSPSSSSPSSLPLSATSSPIFSSSPLAPSSSSSSSSSSTPTSFSGKHENGGSVFPRSSSSTLPSSTPLPHSLSTNSKSESNVSEPSTTQSSAPTNYDELKNFLTNQEVDEKEATTTVEILKNKKIPFKLLKNATDQQFSEMGIDLASRIALGLLKKTEESTVSLPETHIFQDLRELQEATGTISQSPLPATEVDDVLDREELTNKFWEHIKEVVGEARNPPTSWKPRLLVSGNLSGMGKTTFGCGIIPLLLKNLGESKSESLFPGYLDTDVLRRSRFFFLNCNSGEGGDNWFPERDFESARDWLAFRLFARGNGSPAIPLLKAIRKVTAKKLALQMNIFDEILSSILLSQNSNPFLFFVYLDEYVLLERKKGSRFVKDVLNLMGSLTGQMLREYQCVPVIFVTATIDPAKAVIEPTHLRRDTLSLNLLSPSIVLENLWENFHDHPLLGGLDDPDGKVYRWWSTLLHDIGVVPIFLSQIKRSLKKTPTQTLTRLMLVDSIKNESGQRRPKVGEADLSSEASLRILQYALTKQKVNFDTVVDEVEIQDEEGNSKRKQITFRDVAKVGTLLYETKDGNEVVIHLPVVLLADLTCRYQIPHFHELCQFPAPDAGVPFEVQVLKTIVVRLSILNQRTLPAIFPGVTVTAGEYSCCVSHVNLFSDPSSRFEYNRHSDDAFRDNLDLDQVSALEDLQSGIVYKMRDRMKGLDGLLFLGLVGVTRNVVLLIQCKSSDSPKSAQKTGKKPFLPALTVQDNFIRKFPTACVLLLYITQQKIPSSLSKENKHTFYSIHNSLDQFALPNLQHRFSLPPPHRKATCLPTNAFPVSSASTTSSIPSSSSSFSSLSPSSSSSFSPSG